MSTVTFDTDAIIQRLKSRGMPEDQARDIVQAMRDAQTELVTKPDLRDAVADIKSTLRLHSWILTVHTGMLFAMLYKVYS
jgi:predicted RNase H-like nuclease